jgi:HSP20 family molecular chaperone IbpA
MYTQGLEQAFTFPDVPQEQEQQQQRTTGERAGKRRAAAGATAMAIDITEKDECYDMKLDLPGRKP